MAVAFLAFTRAFVKAAPGRDASLRSLVFVLVFLVVVYFDGEATMASKERGGTEDTLLGERKFITVPRSQLFGSSLLLSAP